MGLPKHLVWILRHIPPPQVLCRNRNFTPTHSTFPPSSISSLWTIDDLKGVSFIEIHEISLTSVQTKTQNY